jgi:hypothetical protein
VTRALAVGAIVAITASMATAQPAPPDPVPPPDTSPPPPEDEPDPTAVAAIKHFEKGQQHYELREWGAAIASFKEAYRLLPDPAFLFNLAQAHRLAGDCLAAHDQYKAYLRAAPADAPNRSTVEGFVGELAPCAKQRREQATTGSVRVRTRRGLRIAGIATFGGGLALAGLGAVFFARAENASDTLRDAYDDDPLVWTEELERLERTGPRDEKIGIALTALGGAAVIGGAVMFVLGGRTTVEVPVVAPRADGGVEASWTWQF